jgi:predicted ArsR family transcriptional regulator
MLQNRTEQLSFDLLCLDAPRARRLDPQTSHAAAADAKDLAKQHAILILGALRYCGPSGVDAIARATKLSPYQVSKRMAELEKARAIKLTGRTVPSDAGRAQREWATA